MAATRFAGGALHRERHKVRHGEGGRAALARPVIRPLAAIRRSGVRLTISVPGEESYDLAMDDRADLIAFLTQSRRRFLDDHNPPFGAADEADCTARADGYLAAGRLSDAEVLRLAALPVGARVKAVQDRYGETWPEALADQRRRRSALGWTPPES